MNEYKLKFDDYVKELYNSKDNNERQLSISNAILAFIKIIFWLLLCIIKIVFKIMPIIIILVSFSFIFSSTAMSTAISMISSTIIFVLGIMFIFLFGIISFIKLCALGEHRGESEILNLPEFPNVNIYEDMNYNRFFDIVNSKGLNKEILNYLEIDYLQINEENDDKQYILKNYDVTDKFDNLSTALDELERLDDLLITF